MKKQKFHKWGAWQAVYITVVAYVLSILGAALADIFLGNKLPDVQKSFLVYAVNTAILLIVALIFIRSRKIAFKKLFEIPNKSSLYMVPVYYLAYMILTVLVQLIMQTVPGYNVNQDQATGFTDVAGAGLVLVFISLVVLPPLGEEVIFRGILYNGLKTKTKKITAALITSLLFGLAHMQWNVGADTFVLSMVIIYGYEKEKTLWLPIGVHAIKNFVAFLSLFVFKI